MPTLSTLKQELLSIASPIRAKGSARYFKTGPGEYGEGDVFIGITVPNQRKICKKYTELSLKDLTTLLHSKEHEFRTCALFILVEKFKKQKEQIFNLYLKNTKWINNWDLVDISAHHIVGAYLNDKKDKVKILTKLANSKSLWERRIAIIATFAYINKGRSEEAIQIAEILIEDNHDLIHKAVGWMLREMGKKTPINNLFKFLDKHAKTMPRTALRYAIERLPKQKRDYYMKLKK